MRIVCLAENTSCGEGIGCEHGLCLYIQTKKHNILFDFGQTNLFLYNAEKLSVDLSGVDIAVLSHGHYDHGGGVSAFLRVNDRAKVFVNKNAFEPYYNGTDKYIGLDCSQKDNTRFVLTDDTTIIDDELSLLTCNDRARLYDTAGAGLNVLRDGNFAADEFLHEQYLLIKEDRKDVLVGGCAHKGIQNVMSWLAPSVYIGGFHQSKTALDDLLAELARELDRFNTTYYTCHCTGTEQYNYMRGYMSRLEYLSAGQEITL